MKGIQRTITHDGVHIFRLHYTADPDKDPSTPEGQAWLKRELIGYPGGMNDPRWRREMEIDFEAYSGQLLFPYLIEYESVILCDPVSQIPHNWEVTAALDYGGTNPSAFEMTGWDPQGNPTTFWEYYQAPQRKDESEEMFRARKGYRMLAKAIKTGPFWPYMSINNLVITADPSIWNKTQETKAGMRSIADLLSDEGILLTPGKKSKGIDIAWWEKVNYDLWSNPAKPKWRIAKNCTWLWKELKGLRFAEHAPSAQEVHNQKDEVVDKNNHSTDAVKYDMMSRYNLIEEPKKEKTKSETRIDALSKMSSDDFERYYGQDDLGKFQEGARTSAEEGLWEDDDEDYGPSESLGLRSIGYA